MFSDASSCGSFVGSDSEGVQNRTTGGDEIRSNPQLFVLPGNCVDLPDSGTSLQLRELLPRPRSIIFDPVEVFREANKEAITSKPTLHIGPKNQYISELSRPSELQLSQYLQPQTPIDISFPTWTRAGISGTGDVLFIHILLSQEFGRVFTIRVPKNESSCADSLEEERTRERQQSGEDGEVWRSSQESVDPQFCTHDLEQETLHKECKLETPCEFLHIVGEKFAGMEGFVNRHDQDPTTHLFTQKHHNTPKQDNSTKSNNTVVSAAEMDHSTMKSDQEYGQLPVTKSLYIRKQSSQSDIARNQELKDNNPYKEISRTSSFPPRTSSIGMPLSSSIFKGIDSERETKSTAPQSTTSEWTDEYVPEGSADESRSTRSTISDIKEFYVSSPSSEIMGNFVPISKSKPAISSSDGGLNPYEFEPDSPYMPTSRPNTTFSNFIASARDELSSPKVPKPLHMKHARSESYKFIPAQNSSARRETPANQNGYPMQRSESSPNINPGRFIDQFPDEPRRVLSPDVLRFRAGSESVTTPGRRGRSPHRPRQQINNHGEVILPRNIYQDASSSSNVVGYQSPSPARMSNQQKLKDSFSQAQEYGRQATRSPTRALDDVKEYDESVIESPVPPSLNEMKKRSRSPMKKMFGENGWLGKTPNEIQDIKLESKNVASPGKEKTSVMGKIKNKLGEIAERAELNSLSAKRSSRVSNDKPPKLSVLSVSLSAPEQAKIYMELELMVVVSANTFLMNQFSQGRIAVDTIKKTVDAWGSKGRPVVIEFMYDQGTQRDLVALNQHNFRFYGERAGDTMRINSMLYNWKSVATLMAVRTLCNADTVILKLLFDIEQILELLGAREPVMLRLQHLRATANETMRLERQRQSTNPAPMTTGSSRETWSTRSRSSLDCGNASRTYSMENRYSTMKLVPESHPGLI